MKRELFYKIRKIDEMIAFWENVSVHIILCVLTKKLFK